MILLPPEFKRLLSALSSKEVDYLVVGGYAEIYRFVLVFLAALRQYPRVFGLSDGDLASPYLRTRM